MIVVAASGDQYLQACLSSVIRFRPPDTGVRVETGGGYDTGKYVRATRGLPDDTVVCCIQDSIEITGAMFFRGFSEAGSSTLAAPLVFPLATDQLHPQELGWVIQNCGSYSHDGFGVFGPMFFAPVWFIQKAAHIDVFNKAKQTAMERGWAVLAKANGLQVKPLFASLDEAPFRKHFPRRE